MKKATIALGVISIIFGVFALAGLFMFTPLSTFGGAPELLTFQDGFNTFTSSFLGWFTFTDLISSIICVGLIAIVALVCLAILVVGIIKRHFAGIFAVIAIVLSSLCATYVGVIYLTYPLNDSLMAKTIKTIFTDTTIPLPALIASFAAIGFLVLTILFVFILMIVSFVYVCKNDDPEEEYVNDDPIVLVSPTRQIPQEAYTSPKVEEPKEENKEVAPSAIPCAERAPIIINQYFSNGMPANHEVIKQDSGSSEVPMKASLDEAKVEAADKKKSDVDLSALMQVMHNELLPDAPSCIHTIIPERNVSPLVIDPDMFKDVGVSEDRIRIIVREELERYFADKLFVQDSSVKEEPVSEQVESVSSEEVIEPANEEEQGSDDEVAEQIETNETNATPNKIIRIPFTDRIKNMEESMRNNFNELKSELMAYGMHSRVSNSGDTFRLHTKTYVKITIAGKSLKLYFALDPKDYENTTIPHLDAGHKGIYKEIPFVFKVKSDLSLRRAKQLIADVMEKDKLEKGEIENRDWIQEIIDSNN